MEQAVVDRVPASLDGNPRAAGPRGDLVAAARTLAEAATRLAESGGAAGLGYGRLARGLARPAGECRPDGRAILAASPRFAAASSGSVTAVEAIAGWPGAEADRIRLAMLLLRACIWHMPGDPAAAPPRR